MSAIRRTMVAEVRKIISQLGIQCPPERLRFPQPQLKELFEGLFVCPLCRQKRLKLFEARFDPEAPDVLFIMFCHRCDAEIQYSITRDTIEEVKEDLVEARMSATALNSQYKATSRHCGLHGSTHALDALTS